MKTKPNVGDVVYLNDEGLESISGARSREAIKQSQRMTITEVSEQNLTDDCVTHVIEVDQPLITRFIITNHDVDILEEV